MLVRPGRKAFQVCLDRGVYLVLKGMLVRPGRKALQVRLDHRAHLVLKGMPAHLVLQEMLVRPGREGMRAPLGCRARLVLHLPVLWSLLPDQLLLQVGTFAMAQRKAVLAT